MLSKLEMILVGAVVLAATAIGLILYGEHRYETKQALQWSTAVKAKQDEVDKAKKVGITLLTKLKAAQEKSTVAYKTIIRYVPKKEIVYVNQTPVSNGPITISNNDLFVWNSSTQGSTSLPSPAFGVAGSSADSHVTLQSLLSNYSTNSAACVANTRQLRALIAWETAAKGP